MSALPIPELTTTTCVTRFVLDGEIISAKTTPTRTLLDYLREDLGRTGTKEGCAEGDCGACTVVVGEPSESGIRYTAVNSCIRFVPTLDGKEIVTVESLVEADGSLHPVQQAMVDTHASQCGFCTPGFVMSLFALYLEDAHPNREAVVDCLSGNLCRCTGYRPIIDAGLTMSDAREPKRWSRADAQSPERIARLRGLARSGALELGDEFAAPVALADLAQRYNDAPDSLLLAGGTDVGLWVTKLYRTLPPILYLGDVVELKQIDISTNAIEIGAAVNLSDAYAAIVNDYPSLAELGNRFASPPVRNSGTLCGNLANGSPIGDSMPVLIALGASVRLRQADKERVIALEDLYLGYQKKSLLPGELVVSVIIPRPIAQEGAERFIACYKIAKRFDQDISAVCAGFVVTVANGEVLSARIAYGGVAATPVRARTVEAALVGKPWTRQRVEAAMTLFSADFQPISDMRASADYRATVSANLLLRFYLEFSGIVAALHVHELTPG